MALSCVYRTGQRFGAAHVTDVLMGAETDRIKALGHDVLSTYGIGRHLDKAAWRSILRQLVAHGFLSADPQDHGGLRLAGEARALLRGEMRLALRREAPPPRRGARTRRVDTGAPIGGAQDAVFDALRAWRRRHAEEQGVPPYVIFHDRTLWAIAERRPSSLDALGTITGIGERKLARYGTELLAAVAAA